MRLFDNLFSKKNANPGPDRILADFCHYQQETDEMLKSAKIATGPSVVLTPAVPLPASPAAGWFGGHPRLAAGDVWPKIDGTPLCFVAQIDLGQLPQGVWSATGPREGQLAIFLHPNRPAATALHVTGKLETRQAPQSNDPSWGPMSREAFDANGGVFPEWPVQLSTCIGELPEPAGNWLAGRCLESNPHTFASETPDLLNPAHQPFDRTTFDALTESAKNFVRRQLSHVTGYLDTKRLRPSLAAELITLEEDLEHCQKTLDEVQAKWDTNNAVFDPALLESDLQKLSKLPAGSTRNVEVDTEGYAVIQVSQGTLPQFCDGYLASLERYARYAYVKKPSVLSEEAKTRFEKEWSFVARHEAGGLSHPPKGHLYTPHGSSSRNEVLLELPTSDLMGWVFGDVYSIVLFIDRNDLAAGNFDRIKVEISN